MRNTQFNSLILARLVAATALLCLLSSGCGDDAGSEPVVPGKGAAAKGDPVETFLAGLRAFNEANLEELLDAYTPEATWEAPGSGAPLVRGRKAVARQIVAFKGLLPESTIGARRVLKSREWLVIQAVLQGTHRWNAQGIQRPPKQVGYEMIYFVRPGEGGAANETIVYYDQTSLRRQLGAMKGPSPALPAWPDAVERVDAPAETGASGIADKMLAVVERGAFDELDALVTADFTVFDRASGRRYSLAEIKQRLGKDRESFAEPRIEVEQTVGAGKYVAVRFVQRSRYHPAGDAGPGAEAPVLFHGAYVFTVEGGKIAALETYTNEMELIVQAKQLAAEKKARQADAGAE